MIDKMLSLVAPHHCSVCDKTGDILCVDCKYDIIRDKSEFCLACGSAAGPVGVCSVCKVDYERAWCVGLRQEALEELINNFKFEYAKATDQVLAELLDSTLPELPPNTVIVPVPTIASHIRQRGYDHTLLVVRQFAPLRRLPVQTCLACLTKSRQRGSGRSQRIEQAKVAYGCDRTLDSDKIYLLVDDVVTTGATLHYGAKALKDAGAKTVWAAAIARQPID